MNGTTPHIVQCQGSKRNLASQILRYFPPKFNRLIEPFAGMAAITIAVSKQRRAEHYVLNDLNEPLINILREAINNPQKLIEEYTRVWSEQITFEGGSVEHFYKIRKDFNDGDKSAANMLYLLARCVKGAVRYSTNGMFNQSPDKRRMGTNPKNLAPNVYTISNLLKGKTDFSSVDYRDVAKMTCRGDIVYMAPPYQGVCTTRDSRYFSGNDFDEFVECVDDLNRRGIDFVISYDGTCGEKQYGVDLPKELKLKKVMLNAGLSSQSLLLGKKEKTVEALYISPNLSDTTSSIPEEQLLQIDHRVPYEIGGEQGENIDGYMLLSPSANRAKSWTCEHCLNWTIKDIEFCNNCFWAHPENYSHIAGHEEKQIVITFSDNEIEDYNQLISSVGREKAENKIKELISEYVKNGSFNHLTIN